MSLRVAMLTRNSRELARRTPGAHVSEEKIAALAQWPKSPLYSAAERACLEFTEQYVIDVAGMTDDIVNNLLKHYDSSAIFALVHAICR